MKITTLENLFVVIITLTILYPQTPQLKFQSFEQDQTITGEEVDPYFVIDNDNNLGLCFTRLGSNSIFSPRIKYAYEDNPYWTTDNISPYSSGEFLEAQMHYIGTNRILSFRWKKDFDYSNYMSEGGWYTFLDPNTGSWQEENSLGPSFAHTSYMDNAAGDEIHFLSVSNYSGTRELRYFKRNSNGTYTPSNGYTVVSSNNIYQGATFDLTIGDAGNPYFCYRVGNNLKARKYGENEVVISSLTQDNNIWNRKLLKAAPPTIAYNGNSGILMIVFSDYDNDTGLWSLFYSILDNASSTWSTPEKVFNNTVQMTYPYLSADINSGNFFLSYYSFDDSQQTNHVYLSILGYSAAEGNFGNSPIEIDVGKLDNDGFLSYFGRPIHSKVVVDANTTKLFVSTVYFDSYNDTDVRLYEIGFPNGTLYNFKNMVVDENAGGDLELTNNTTSATETITSGTQRTLTIGDNYSVETLPRRYDDYNYNMAVDDYQHHHWNQLETSYLLSNDFSPSFFETGKYAMYEVVENVTINTNIGTFVTEIKDPWWVDPAIDQQHDPPVFHTVSQPGQYQVFLNQNPNNEPDKPYYSLRAPSVGQVTQSDIYVFDGWTVSPPDGATLNSNARTTSVVFHDVGSPVTITANYVSALTAPGREVIIQSDETVTIPAGGTYQWDNTVTDFRFYVEGNLVMSGTVQYPITFGPGSGSTNDIGGIYVDNGGSVTLDYVHFDHTAYAFTGWAVYVYNGQANITNCRFTNIPDGAIEVNSYATAYIANCEFTGSQSPGSIGIDCYVTQGSGNTVTIRNNTIVDFQTGVRASCNTTSGTNTLDMRNNILYYHNTGQIGTICFDYSIDSWSTVALGYNNSYGFENNGSDFDREIIANWLLNQDPLFQDYANGDYTFTSNSPVIDKGDPDLDDDGINWDNDPDDQDVDGTRLDIGAYPYLYYSGTINEAVVWAGGTIHITADLTIGSAGGSLTILPGTQVKVAPDKYLMIEGDLNIDGAFFSGEVPGVDWMGLVVNTPADITITDASFQGSRLLGLYLADCGSGSIIQNTTFDAFPVIVYQDLSISQATFKNAHHSDPTQGELPALFISGVEVTPTITNCVFHDNDVGLLTNYRSTPVVRRNTFYNNQVAITATAESRPNLQSGLLDLEDCDYTNNWIYNNGTGIFINGATQPLVGYDLEMGTDPAGNYFFEYPERTGWNRVYGNGADIDVQNSSGLDIYAAVNNWNAAPSPGYPCSNYSPVLGGATNYVHYVPTVVDAVGAFSIPGDDTLYPDLVELELEGEYTLAMDGYNGVIEENPDSDNVIWALAGLARCYQALNQPNEFINALETLGADYPGTTVEKYARSMEATQRIVRNGTNDLDEAQAEIDWLKTQYPNDELIPKLLYEEALIQELTGGILGKRRADTPQIQALPLGAVQTYQELVTRYRRTSFGTLAAMKLLLNGSVSSPNVPIIPNRYVLRQNYPNPFNPTTTVVYELPELSVVRLTIFDLLGREVAELVNRVQPEGIHHIRWNGKDNRGNPLPSGMYLYRLSARSTTSNQTYTQTRKLVLLK